MISVTDRFIVEVRDKEGKLDFDQERIKRKEHPYLFSKETFGIDDLCYYMSFGQGRGAPSGPMDLDNFMDSIGIEYRKKTW